MGHINIALLVLLFCVIGLYSCGGAVDEVEPVNMKDTLKISAYLLDESLEGTGYWAYSEEPHDFGYWVSDDGKHIDTDDVFTFERLELNDDRILAPMGYKYMDHINVHLDFDGIIEVEVGDEGDENIRLVHSLEYPEEPWLGGKIHENEFRALGPLTVSINPIGTFYPELKLGQHDTLVGKDYYINIRTYDQNNTQIIAAKLKLSALKDEAYPYEDIEFTIYGPNEERSRFLSIELISYEYSDIYKFDEELVETK